MGGYNLQVDATAICGHSTGNSVDMFVLLIGATDGYLSNLFRYLPFSPSLHPLWHLYFHKHIRYL